MRNLLDQIMFKHKCGRNNFLLSGRRLRSLTQGSVALTVGPSAVFASAALTLPGDVL